MRGDQHGLDETPTPSSHDDQLKALQGLKVARQHQTLDWLNVAGDTPLALPGVLTLELTQPRNI